MDLNSGVPTIEATKEAASAKLNRDQGNLCTWTMQVVANLLKN